MKGKQQNLKKVISKKTFLIIGDIHGLTDWQQLVKNNILTYDKIIFLGDYVDSFNISATQQLSNLIEILNFKRAYPEKVILLLGNHDYAYIHNFSQISGFQTMFSIDYKELFSYNINLFQLAWGFYDNFGKYTLITHAGLTYKYWNEHIKDLFNEGEFLHKITSGKTVFDFELHETLNFLIDKKDIIWKVGPARYGTSLPSIIWADYSELIYDPYPDINQIFGHTPTKSNLMNWCDGCFHICVDFYKNDKISSLILNV